MRTTLILNDDLVVRAKKRAAEAQVSLSEWVNAALRESLSVKTGTGAEALNIPVYSSNTSHSVEDNSPSNFHELLVAEDMTPYSETD
ncbi:MAG: hypothetical protein AAGB06_01990 [Verrucomicrobiota bacterium]